MSVYRHVLLRSGETQLTYWLARISRTEKIYNIYRGFLKCLTAPVEKVPTNRLKLGYNLLRQFEHIPGYGGFQTVKEVCLARLFNKSNQRYC